MSTQRHLMMAAAAASFIALGAREAWGQWNVTRFDSSTTWAYTSYGLDPAVVGSIGFARSIPQFRESLVSAEVGWVVAGFDARDFRGRVTAQTSAVRWRSLRLTGDVALSARGTTNSIYRALGIGAATTWTLGVYRPRWFAGTEAGIDHNMATRITHTDWYKTYFYPDAKDGWYGGTGGTIHYGLTGGVTLGRTELMTRAGFLRTEQLNETVPPMYVNVGFGFKVR